MRVYLDSREFKASAKKQLAITNKQIILILDVEHTRINE